MEQSMNLTVMLKKARLMALRYPPGGLGGTSIIRRLINSNQNVCIMTWLSPINTRNHKKLPWLKRPTSVQPQRRCLHLPLDSSKHSSKQAVLFYIDLIE